MGNRMTQEDKVLQYMQKFGSISSWQAFSDLGVTRLSAKIFNLRKEWDIADETILTTNRFGEKTHYKRYFIKGKY